MERDSDTEAYTWAVVTSAGFLRKMAHLEWTYIKGGVALTG